MLQRIEHLARVSIARACGFAGLGICTFMLGFADQPIVLLKSAGYLVLLVCLVLLLKAWTAEHQPYKRTELWLMLKAAEKPHDGIAQQVISTVLREVYIYFALQSAVLAAGFLLVAVVLATVTPLAH